MLKPGERDAQLKKNADIQSDEKTKFDEKYLEIVNMVEKSSKTKHHDDDENNNEDNDENDFLTNIDNSKLLEPFKKHYQKDIDQKGKQLNHMQDLVDYLDELLEHARENETEVNEIKSQSSHIINTMNTLKHDLANLTVLVNKGN